jgi:excisionase family DNA binding protein
MRDPRTTTRRHAMRSVREAARDTGVPEVTLRRWIAEGELFAVRLGPTALVDLGEVVAVRDRLVDDVPPRRGWAWPPVLTRAIGAGDLIVGALGILAILGIGPDGFGSAWSLVVSLLCLAIGAVLLRPDRLLTRLRA